MLHYMQIYIYFIMMYRISDSYRRGCKFLTLPSADADVLNFPNNFPIIACDFFTFIYFFLFISPTLLPNSFQTSAFEFCLLAILRMLIFNTSLVNKYIYKHTYENLSSEKAKFGTSPKLRK